MTAREDQTARKRPNSQADVLSLGSLLPQPLLLRGALIVVLTCSVFQHMFYIYLLVPVDFMHVCEAGEKRSRG